MMGQHDVSGLDAARHRQCSGNARRTLHRRASLPTASVGFPWSAALVSVVEWRCVESLLQRIAHVDVRRRAVDSLGHDEQQVVSNEHGFLLGRSHSRGRTRPAAHRRRRLDHCARPRRRLAGACSDDAKRRTARRHALRTVRRTGTSLSSGSPNIRLRSVSRAMTRPVSSITATMCGRSRRPRAGSWNHLETSCAASNARPDAWLRPDAVKTFRTDLLATRLDTPSPRRAPSARHDRREELRIVPDTVLELPRKLGSELGAYNQIRPQPHQQHDDEVARNQLQTHVATLLRMTPTA